jgi:hypothetical protein
MTFELKDSPRSRDKLEQYTQEDIILVMLFLLVTLITCLSMKEGGLIIHLSLGSPQHVSLHSSVYYLLRYRCLPQTREEPVLKRLDQRRAMIEFEMLSLLQGRKEPRSRTPW